MKTAFEELMDVRGLDRPEDGAVRMEGADPVFSTRFKIGETCANVVGAIGVAVSDIWEMQTGRRQRASVDVRHAAASLRSSHYLEKPRADGSFAPVVSPSMTHMASITQPWPTKDGRWFLPHFNLPHLRERVLGVLDCEATPQSVSEAVGKWDALELEGAIAEARACGGMVRDNAEWLDHPHGRVLAAKPLVEIIKIGDSEPEPIPAGGAPLSGIRVLDLTRILAGPTAAHLPQVTEHVLDTSHGKRSCFLDLKSTDGAARLKALAKSADVFSQGYRPGMLQGLGFGPEDLARERPGIVYLSISCYGADGPFSGRAGWEQVAQTVTGILHDGGEDRPALLPAAACDYTTGYLGAYGVLLALARRAREGGSYHVRVSLCQSGMFIYRQGKTAFSEPGMDLTPDELAAIRIHSDTEQGPIKHLGPVLRLSETAPGWSRPTPVLGGHAPEWLNAAHDAAAD